MSLNFDKIPNTVIRQSVCTITGKNQTDIYLERFSKIDGKTILLMTTYTDTIISPEGEKIIVAEKDTRKVVFIASKMIEKDFENSEIIADEIPVSAIKFYQLSEKEFFHESGILIDIKAAYPSILKSIGAISEQTFDFLMNLKKVERLKAIGMLASNKIKIEIENGIYSNPEALPLGKNAVVYFIAAYEIGEILHKCKVAAGNDFLFYWFDGIYIKTNYSAAAKIMKTIKNSGLDCTMHQVSGIKQEKTEKGNFCFTWTEITPNLKTKCINLPTKPKNFFR